MYEITNENFNYGASINFSVSTDDKKLYRMYKTLVTTKTYSELREMPYLSIAKSYSEKKSYSKKHSVMYITCNQKCNPTQLNYDFKSEWYSLQNLK